MSPGPPPTPTAILDKRGSRLAPERLRDAVHAEPGIPEPPKWLDATALEVWHEMVKILKPMGVLCLSDRRALARYCTLWVRWQICEDHIREHGLTYAARREDGEPTRIWKWPHVDLSIQLGDQLLKLEQQFGLTPSARSRVKISAPKKSDDAKPFKFRIA